MPIKTHAAWQAQTLLDQAAAIAAFRRHLGELQALMEVGVPVEESLPELLRVALDEALAFGDERLLFIALGEIVASRSRMTPHRYRRLEEALYFGFAGEAARSARYDDDRDRGRS